MTLPLRDQCRCGDGLLPWLLLLVVLEIVDPVVFTGDEPCHGVCGPVMCSKCASGEEAKIRRASVRNWIWEKLEVVP